MGYVISQMKMSYVISQVKWTPVNSAKERFYELTSVNSAKERFYEIKTKVLKIPVQENPKPESSS